jgi:predicted ATP-grasp superfamily ATP-dependent carboligase
VIKEQTEKYLFDAKLAGIYEFEWKFDPRDNQFKFLEVNPRVGATHPIFTISGINFPYMIYLDACKINLPPPKTYNNNLFYALHPFYEMKIYSHNKRGLFSFIKSLLRRNTYLMHYDKSDYNYNIGIFGQIMYNMLFRFFKSLTKI